MKIKKIIRALSEIENSSSSFNLNEDEVANIDNPDFSIYDLDKYEAPSFSEREKNRVNILLRELSIKLIPLDSKELYSVQKEFGKFKHIQVYVNNLIRMWLRNNNDLPEKKKDLGLQLLIFLVLPNPPIDARDSYQTMKTMCIVLKGIDLNYEEVKKKVIPIACNIDTGIGSLKELLNSLINPRKA